MLPASTTENKIVLWVPILLILYNFCANLTNDIYLPSLPHLVHLFNSTPSILQMTMTAWFAGVAIPQLFFGPLSDRIGRRPVILGGGICFIVSTFICAIASNAWMLIIARFFQGMGVCSLNVASFSIVTDLYNYRQSTKILNKINLFGILAPLLGPVIGGYIFINLGWRANFFIIFLLGFISVLGLWVNLPESNLFLNPKALQRKNLTQNYYFLFFQPGFIKNLLPYCLIMGGLVAYLTAAPFIIIEKLKISPQHFGYTQLPIFGIYILGSLFLDRVNDDEQIRKLMVIGLKLVFIAGLCLIISSYFVDNNLSLFIASMVIYALGFSLCAGPLVAEVMSSAPLIKGSVAAFLGFSSALCCMLASLSLGFIYNGHVFSIASLIFIFSTLSASFYFLLPANQALINEQGG